MKPADRSPLSRRDFLKNLAASSGLLKTDALFSTAHVRPTATESSAKRTGGLIDRQDLVRRHSPITRRLDPLSPLSVGNGEFAFTADVTGLQTFPEYYDRAMPLCTMSQWGWHTTPQPEEFRSQQFRLTMFEVHGRKVGYAVDAEGQAGLYKWLRENPHRLHLGRIGLKLMKTDGSLARAEELTDIEQRLDLWTGLLTSRFRFSGRLVSLTTAVHPAIDLIAVSIESELIARGLLGVRFAFPYGSPAMQAADWFQSGRHKSEATHLRPNHVDIHRTLDGDEYFVAIGWEDEASFAAASEHQFLLIPSTRGTTLKFVTRRSPRQIPRRRRLRLGRSLRRIKRTIQGEFSSVSSSSFRRDMTPPNFTGALATAHPAAGLPLCSGTGPQGYHGRCRKSALAKV